MTDNAEADGRGLEAREEEEQHIWYNQIEVVLGIEQYLPMKHGDILIGQFMVRLELVSKLPVVVLVYHVTIVTIGLFKKFRTAGISFISFTLSIWLPDI